MIPPFVDFAKQCSRFNTLRQKERLILGFSEIFWIFSDWVLKSPSSTSSFPRFFKSHMNKFIQGTFNKNSFQKLPLKDLKGVFCFTWRKTLKKKSALNMLQENQGAALQLPLAVPRNSHGPRYNSSTVCRSLGETSRYVSSVPLLATWFFGQLEKNFQSAFWAFFNFPLQKKQPHFCKKTTKSNQV